MEKDRDKTQTLTLPPIPKKEGAVFHAKDFFADSHTGLVRKENQDAFAYKISDNRKMAFLLVADGIGGNERGDLASAYIAQVMMREFEKFQVNGLPTKEQALDFLSKTFHLAHSALRNLNSNFNIQHPMGSTVTTLLLLPGLAITGNAGDSRVYCLKNGKLIQYTNDHSVVNELIRKGVVSPEAAKTHPMAHVIYQSMGVMFEIQPEFKVFERDHGDRFLVCSDGIMLHMDDKSLRNVILAADSPRKAVNFMVSMILRSGAGDNTTAICAFPED